MQRSLQREVGPRQKRKRYTEEVRQLLLGCENSESSSGNNINCVKFDLITPHYFRRRFRLPQWTSAPSSVGRKWNSQFEYGNWFVSVLIWRTQTSVLFKFYLDGELELSSSILIGPVHEMHSNVQSLLEENTTEYGITFNVINMSNINKLCSLWFQLMYLQVVTSKHIVYVVMNLEK